MLWQESSRYRSRFNNEQKLGSLEPTIICDGNFFSLRIFFDHLIPPKKCERIYFMTTKLIQYMIKVHLIVFLLEEAMYILVAGLGLDSSVGFGLSTSKIVS